MSVNYFYKTIKGKKYLYVGETKRVDGKLKRIWQKYLQTVHNFVGDCGVSFIANRG